MVIGPSRPKEKYVYGNSPRDTQLRLNEMAFFERMAIEESTRVNLTSVVRRYVSFCECLGLRPFPVSFKDPGPLLGPILPSPWPYNTLGAWDPVALKRASRCRGGVWLSEGVKAPLDDVVAGLTKYDRSPSARKLPSGA